MKTVNSLEEMIQLEQDGDLIGLFKVSNKIYHEGPGLSRSYVPHLNRSIRHYLKEKKANEVYTQAMSTGNILHSLVLEPETFDERYLFSPDCQKRSNADKETWRLYEEKLAETGKEALDKDIFELASAMKKALLSKITAKKLLMGYKEVAAFWIDEETGILCKLKTDVLGYKTGIIADLKSTESASPMGDGFIKSVHKYNYHIQNAWYCDGIVQAVKQGGKCGFDFYCPDNFKFVFIAIEKEEPYACAFYDLPPDFIENGREKYRHALGVYKKYLTDKKEEDYEQQIITLKPQGYMYK